MRQRYRVCSEPGCPQLHASAKGRCPEHERAHDALRGSATERGYGPEHRRRGDLALAGATHCQRCGQPFTVDNPATRGHVVNIRDGGTPADGYIAECQTCNYGWGRGLRRGPSSELL